MPTKLTVHQILTIPLVLFAACGLAHPQTVPTTQATRPLEHPYAGLSLRDDPQGRTLVTHIAPGPLEGRGFRSPHLLRGDTILSVNGSTMNAQQFADLVKRSNVGDEIVLQVKRTGSTTVTGVPTPAPDGKLEELRFKLADKLAWVGPVEHPNSRRMDDAVAAIDQRVSPTTAPTQLEAFVEQQLAAHELTKPVGDLEQLLIKTQREDWGFNSLSHVAYGFVYPRKLPRLQKTITDPLPAIANDPRQILVQAAKLIDVEPPALAEPSDLSNPSSAVESIAKLIDAARTDLDRAWAAMSSDEGASLRDSMIAILSHVARPSTLDSSMNPTHTIKTLQSTMRIDYNAMMSAASKLSGLLNAQPLAASQTENVALPTELDGIVTGPIRAAKRSANGWIVYGSTDANTYDLSRLVAVIDPGGDDVYRYTTKERHAVQAVIDYAGNDQYISETGAGPAATVMGINYLIDLAGDDVYRGQSISCGAGVLGVGILVDRGGDDRYEGTAWSQGAGVYGIGAIIDTAGTDVYIAQNHSQAIGGPRGCGVILDAVGDDLYRANGPTRSAYSTPAVYYAMSQGVGFGFRYYDSGGVGILEDVAGADRYEAGEFAQGGAYYYGLGILHDRSGNDCYFGNRYSQGFCAHEGIGICADDSGDDTYWGMTAANQAGSWDLSVAMLIDRAGNDTYRGDGLSQGSAAMQAIAWLIDLGGVDHYVGAGSAIQGQSGGNEYHFTATGCFSWSLSLDAGGANDFFSSGRANNASVKTGSTGEQKASSDLNGLFIDTSEQISIDAK